ncbi:MAG: hypothetical protein QF492_02865 [Candidatus Krumholzibacteria bacterium]|jgi:hypothetical protein|nr:hypothetical protein [Candidatus Krumholzibacteria bacterium]MDP6668839.1 hypothetical protein [Candidatus Krumholzibacteria bacterium]MDP6797765.1 hypothetical protein [Candidatus Krumholzibacteria bacterium]MDP7022016.1 hypothetical protein [Candidatus Krumholzibacteria bacterium]
MRFVLAFLVFASFAAAQTFDFPLASDTWSSGSNWWWSEGNTVYGDRDVTGPVTQAEVVLYLSGNGLTEGNTADLDFRLDGVTVGTLHITAEDGLGPITGSFSFDEIDSPSELRYTMASDICGGCGAINLKDALEVSTVTLSTGTATDESNWSFLKSSY